MRTKTEIEKESDNMTDIMATSTNPEEISHAETLQKALEWVMYVHSDPLF